jgi:hypothetical protein
LGYFISDEENYYGRLLPAKQSLKSGGISQRLLSNGKKFTDYEPFIRKFLSTDGQVNTPIAGLLRLFYLFAPYPVVYPIGSS